MRGLKVGAIAAVSLLLVMVLLVGYLFATAQVSVVRLSAQGTSAASDPEGFEAVRQSVEEDTFQGMLYQKPLEWKDASEYAWLTYTIRLHNGCLVPLDMIEAQVVPQSMDILQTADLQVHSLAMKSDGDLQVTILTDKNAHPVRELIVTYYVWGVSFSLKTTLGETEG